MEASHITDKGKGKVPTSSNSMIGPQSADKAQNAPGLTSRVVSSAIGLTRGLGGPANGNLASILTSSAASSGKVRPSVPNGSGSSGSEVLQSHQTSASSRTNGSVVGESFRTSQQDADTAAQFEQFSAVNNPFQPLSSTNGEKDATSWTAEFQHRLHTHGPTHDSHGQHDGVTDSSTYALDDGAEVRELLSDPYFVAMTDIYDTHDPTAADVADLFPQASTADEQAAVAKIKADLPPAPVHGQVAPLSLSELMARFDGDIASPAGEASGQVSFTSPAQHERWHAEWSQVLTGYTDAVWGELAPEVRALRQHLERVRRGTETLDARAVARLKMILRHVGELQRQDVGVVAEREPFDAKKAVMG